jgi:Zn finger protein HypA/HybF involved in hydrogenase expression
MYDRYALQHTRCSVGWKLYFALCEEKARQVNRPEGNRDWSKYNIALGNFVGHQGTCPQCKAHNREIAEAGRVAVHPEFEGGTTVTCQTMHDLWTRWKKGKVEAAAITEHRQSCETCKSQGSAIDEYMEAFENGRESIKSKQPA